MCEFNYKIPLTNCHSVLNLSFEVDILGSKKCVSFKYKQTTTHTNKTTSSTLRWNYIESLCVSIC